MPKIRIALTFSAFAIAIFGATALDIAPPEYGTFGADNYSGACIAGQILEENCSPYNHGVQCSVIVNEDDLEILPAYYMRVNSTVCVRPLLKPL